MNENYTGEKFLDKIFKDIYLSNEVQHTASKSDKKEVAIKKYMDRLERVHNKVRKADRIDLIKQLYYDKYVIKSDKLPYGLSETEKNNIIENQKKRLGLWIDYLTDENSLYPMWAKYWAFQGMLKLGTFDAARGIYQRRSDKTIAPFVEANPEIISNCINDMMNYERSRLYPNEEVESILKTGSFKKLFEYYEKKFKSNQVYTSHSVKGQWVKYNYGSREDAIKLCNSLQNKGTGWCTANETWAINQICGGGSYYGGDFYVYYTEDEEGKCTVPRIAIRMNGEKSIAEIRGVEEHQCLETDMIPILETKLKSMDFVDKSSIEEYINKINDSKYLFNIYRKTIQKEELTEEEIIKLYTKSFGFGWNQDPLVMKTIALRNQNKDVSSITQYAKKLDVVISILSKGLITEKFIIEDKRLMLDVIKRRNGDVLKYASMELRDDKDVVLSAVKKNGWSLSYASDRQADDKDIVLSAVKKYWGAWEAASPRLRKDKDVVIEGIKNNIYLLNNVSFDLVDDKEFMLRAISIDALAYRYVSERLKNDRDLIVAAVKKDGMIIKDLPSKFKDDKEIITIAVGNDPYALEYASPRLRDDRDVVLKSVSIHGRLLQYASDRLKDDKELVIIAIRSEFEAYLDASERLKNDRDVVLEFIKQNGYQFKVIPDKYKSDKEIVIEAVKCDINQLKYADKSLLIDRDFMLELIQFNLLALSFSNTLCDDKEFMLEALNKLNVGAFTYSSERLRNDRDFVLKAVDIDLRILSSTHFRNDKSFMLDAIRQNKDAIKYLRYSGFTLDKPFILETVRIDGRVLEFAPSNFTDDKEIVLEAIKSNSYAFKYASLRLRNDKEVVFEAIKKNPTMFKFAGNSIKTNKDILIKAIKLNPLAYKYIPEDFKKNKLFTIDLLRECPEASSFVLSGNPKLDEEIISLCTKAICTDMYNKYLDSPESFVNEIFASDKDINDLVDDLLGVIIRERKFKQNKKLVNNCKQRIINMLNAIITNYKSNNTTTELVK